jgi:hypothetical protein
MKETEIEFVASNVYVFLRLHGARYRYNCYIKNCVRSDSVEWLSPDYNLTGLCIKKNPD